MDDRQKQADAEKQRWYCTRDALLRLRVDLQNRGVHLLWDRKEVNGEMRLLAVISGQKAGETQVDAYTAAMASMNLISPFFPHAVIEGGKALAGGSWKCLLWLDAPESEALMREAQHPHLTEAAMEQAKRNEAVAAEKRKQAMEKANEKRQRRRQRNMANNRGQDPDS